MSDWVCKQCGTINKDPYDSVHKQPSFVYEKMMEELELVENKGEQFKLYCTRCRMRRG